MTRPNTNVIGMLVLCLAAGRLWAQDSSPQSAPKSGASAAPAKSDEHADDTPHDPLTSEQWRRVDAAVERALAWLARQQKPNGSFPTLDRGQPGVTSLCLLAFMAHGHNPGEGPYGDQLERATQFVMSCQKVNGLLSHDGPDGPRITRAMGYNIGVAAAYNHPIASLSLSEVYGMGLAKTETQMQRVITKSLEAALEMQRWPKDRASDNGGWRYVNDGGDMDSDLSVTGWNLMFLRSARNAGFPVPKSSIDEAVSYIRRTFDEQEGVFGYSTKNQRFSRAMAGAGILALGHAGFHHSQEAQRAGQWLLRRNFDQYNSDSGLPLDRYHYSLFNACHGMYQLGDPYWEKFFPRTVSALLASQRAGGSWDAERFHRDRSFGNSYSTALVVLSLGAPNQFLPVFQR